MKLRNILIVIILSIIVLFTVGLIKQQNHITEDNVPTQPENGLTDEMLQAEFQRIHNLPYSDYQCREKADLLTAYIYRYDKTGELYTVSVPYKDGSYCHVYVEYRGFVYDPTSTPTGKPLYRIDKALWQQQLTAWGFTGQPIVRYGHGGEVDK